MFKLFILVKIKSKILKMPTTSNMISPHLLLLPLPSLCSSHAGLLLAPTGPSSLCCSLCLVCSSPRFPLGSLPHVPQSLLQVTFAQKPFLTSPGQGWPSLSSLQIPPSTSFLFPKALTPLLDYGVFVSRTRIPAPQVQDFGVFCSLPKSQLPAQYVAHSVCSGNVWGMNE